MKKFTLLLASLSLLLVSCSQLPFLSDGYESRFPANDNVLEKLQADGIKIPDVESPVSSDEVFTIKRTASGLGETDYAPSNPKKALEGKGFFDSDAYRNVKGSFDIIIEKSDKLPEDVAFKLVPETEGTDFVIRVLANADAFEDDLASYKVTSFVKHVKDLSKFNSFYEFFEMSYNAQNGDPEAIENFLKMRKQDLEAANTKSPSAAVSQDLDKINTQMEEMTVAIKDLKKQRKAIAKEKKPVLDALITAADDQQLKGLVAAGKRQEVADLLKKFLPWHEMAPSEIKFWQNTLDIMANPLPMSERVLTLRGISGDMVYPAIEAGVQMEREIAEKQGKVFIMSSVLTKNQGTWNRRLRSLETGMNKIISWNAKTKKNEFSKSARVSTMFYQHSINPAGSPFLSYTPKKQIANQFGSDRMVAMLMDPRYLYSNFASAYAHEVEFLNTLITFPDEMVGLWDKETNAGTEKFAYFLEQLDRKLVQELGEVDGKAAFKEINSVYEDFNKLKNVQEVQEKIIEKKPKKTGSLFGWFKKFFVKKQPVVEVAEVIEEVAEPEAKVKACHNIIALFFKK